MSDGFHNPYRLSKRHNQNWFERTILPEYEKYIGKIVFPRIAIVSGQPGSGKSTAKKIVQTSFGLQAEVLCSRRCELKMVGDQPDRVEDVINAERNKPWIQADRDAHLKEWQRLDKLMKAAPGFPAFIIGQAKPFIEEANYLAKSRALQPDDDKAKGTIVHTSPHCVFVEFGNGEIAEVPQLPNKKIDLMEGDAWLPRPYPARPADRSQRIYAPKPAVAL